MRFVSFLLIVLALATGSASARPLAPENGEDGDRTPAGAALFARKLVASSSMGELATIYKSGNKLNGAWDSDGGIPRSGRLLF
jgi:hypothetical protein